MRKLYKHNKGKIHPSPPPTTTTTTTTTTTADHLSLLPLAIAALAASLAPEDKEVLAYLLSCSVAKTFSGDTKIAGAGVTHPAKFNCYCFSCYTNYWVRWDGSPNQQLIHEIIDAYEDGLINNKRSGKNKKDRKKNKVLAASNSSHAPPSDAESVSHAPPQAEENTVSDDGGGDEDGLIVATSSSDKGSVRKLVSFIGERIWGVWGV